MTHNPTPESFAGDRTGAALATRFLDRPGGRIRL